MARTARAAAPHLRYTHAKTHSPFKSNVASSPKILYLLRAFETPWGSGTFLEDLWGTKTQSKKYWETLCLTAPAVPGTQRHFHGLLLLPRQISWVRFPGELHSARGRCMAETVSAVKPALWNFEQDRWLKPMDRYNVPIGCYVKRY